MTNFLNLVLFVIRLRFGQRIAKQFEFVAKYIPQMLIFACHKADVWAKNSQFIAA